MIPYTDFFKYLQIRNSILALMKKDLLSFDLSEIENALVSSTVIKGKIAEFYELLAQGSRSSFISVVKTWEKDLGMELDENTWQYIFENTYFPFTSNKIKEANFKFIYRLYLTPVRMHKISKDISPNCLRCKAKEGTFMHLFWYCDTLKSFWNSIHSFTKKVLQTELDQIPSVY